MIRPACLSPLLVLAVMVLPGTATMQAQEPCRVTPVALASTGAGHASYTATRGPWRLSIRNAEAPKPASAFNEDPLEVTDTRTGTTCRIEGGIWLPGGFALVDGKNRLAAIESSGSDVAVTVYDLASCRARQRLPVVSGVVAYQNGEVRIGEDCKGHALSSCRTSQAVPAATLCR